MRNMKDNLIKKIILSGFVALLALVPMQTVYASEIDAEFMVQEDTDVVTDIIATATASEMAGVPVREKPELPDADFTTDVFYTQTTMQGIMANKELFFFIPTYWDTQYVYVELQYDASELIKDIDSALTFYVNGTPICSYRISYEEGNSQTCFLNIPMDNINEGYNSLTISAYARITDGAATGCADDFTNANWLSIADTSYIRCGYNVVDAEDTISWYPYPFMSTTNDTGIGLTIAVSDKATSGELEAAMNLMSDLSTETGDENNIQFCLLSDLNDTNPNRTVLVSNYDNLPAEYRDKVDDSYDLSAKAVVVFTDDAKSNPMLIVTSKDEECLVEAAYMLMDEKRVAQEKGSVAVVNKGSADVAVNATSLSQMAMGNYTIKDIVGSGLSFYGPFRQEQYVYLPFTEDYFLSDAGKMTLKFRYSKNLDFNRSLITVFWGDVPVASKKLSEENAGGDELTFSMPSDVVGTTTGAIRIAFDLEIPDMVCTPRAEQMPWAYVLDESTLYLPASSGIVLTFDLKPSPFRTDGKFNDLMLVISDEPTSEELNLYAQIIGMYGDGVSPYGTLFVRRVSEFSETDADYHIITAGTYADNTLIQKLNSELYFKYAEDGNSFISNEQLILSDTYAEEVAIMQLMESPYANNRGILAVTVAKDESLENVEDFMRDYNKRYSLTKDCVVIDNDLETSAFQFMLQRTEGAEPTLIGTLTHNKQSLLFTVVATSAMLMMLVAAIIVLVRIRMYHKRKED